jgi:hypothetical protein
VLGRAPNLEPRNLSLTSNAEKSTKIGNFSDLFENLPSEVLSACSLIGVCIRLYVIAGEADHSEMYVPLDSNLL